MKDSQYTQLNAASYKQTHHYGDRVHLLNNLSGMSLLADFCHAEESEPLLSMKLNQIYSQMLNYIIDSFFEREDIEIPTRMSALHAKEGQYRGQRVKKAQKILCVDIARAGALPAQLFYHDLSLLVATEGLHQDHLYMNRKTNDEGEVIGINFTGSKISGSKQGAIILIPDPMGATGNSLKYVYDYYENEVPGEAKAYISSHLIITPEFTEFAKKNCPKLNIVAMRLDRGLSTPEALSKKPGELLAEEKGLNNQQYIVPGAGGVGEILNNTKN